MAETLKPRVEKLETRVGEHHQVLFGPEGCPEQGVVKRVEDHENQLTDIGKLLVRQTTYNSILTWVAGIVGSSVILHILGMVLH